MLEARLPGVRFETRLQPVAEDLPRMDIAAFVGLASQGPLHQPIAIEDPGRFREIFGPDPTLAWDTEAGQTRYGVLGSSVEAFFANGGKRCWIVRVADGDSIENHQFRLSGIKVGEHDGTAGAEVFARARCPGSWCEDLSVGTSLVRELVPLRDFTLEDDVVDSGPIQMEAGQYRFDLIADAAGFETGELLEAYFGDDLPRLFLFVESVDRDAGFVRLQLQLAENGNPQPGAFWMETAGSPPDEDPALETITEADALASLSAAGIDTAIANWATTALNAVVSIRRVRLQIAVWRNAGIVARIGDLGLASTHPRFWGHLPTDRELFGFPSLSRDAREPKVLDAEISSPRFPLAGHASNQGDPIRFHLPLQVEDRLSPQESIALPSQTGTALERDGLASFETSLFVDPALDSTAGSVLVEAEHRYYVLEEDLIGLHSLLPVLEASLIAVPDAFHAGWTRQLPPAPDPLGAPWLLPGSPELIELPPPDEFGGYTVDWTSVDDADGYLLELADNPDFENARTIYEGPETETALFLADDCPRRYYLRVRGQRFGEMGPWSNTRQALIPRELFVSCEEPQLDELRLNIDALGSPPETILSWTALDGFPNAGAGYEYQESTNADFIDALSESTSLTEVTLPENASAEMEVRRYFRVRSIVGDSSGPWSNTAVVEPTQRVAWALLPEAEFEDDVLLDVHRALLRFAGARADMLAMLSLPPHYRRKEAVSHVGKLTAGGGERLTGSANAGRVPPLSTGESTVLSYGTLLHPWMTIRIPDRGVDREEITTSLPPDGAVAGSMANLAIERGAWLAPANEILERVLALTPQFDIDDWKKLVPSKVNLILQAPQGFLLLSEVTLSPDKSLDTIHVRRLLILLRRLALREGDRFVFDNNDLNLRNLVRHRFELVLADLYTRGAFAGAEPDAAYRVVTGESVNPSASVERGRLIVELQVAPAPALAFITVRLVTDERGRLAVEGP